MEVQEMEKQYTEILKKKADGEKKGGKGGRES